MQHTAWIFAGIYTALNVVLTLLLRLYGMSWFDALCHAFGTMATGGFSTYDTSLGHFNSVPGINGALIDYTIILFMILAGTNFTLLYFLLIGKPGRLLADVEWRTYMAIILGVTALVVARGTWHHDFADADGAVARSIPAPPSATDLSGRLDHDHHRLRHARFR